MSETQQQQKWETKIYTLTEDEIKTIDEESLEFIKEPYVQGGHSPWFPSPTNQYVEQTSQTTILEKAMDFFKMLSAKQGEGFTHVGVGDYKYRIQNNNVNRSKWNKDGNKKKPWNGNYVKKDKFLEEIFATTNFEQVNSKLNSNKDHNWEIINTMLNSTDNTVHFIIGRIKPQTFNAGTTSTTSSSTTTGASTSS